EVLQAAMEVLRIVSMSPEHVGLDEVREDQSVVELAQELLRLRDPVDVRLCRMRFVDVLARENVADLPDAVHLHPLVTHEREVVRAPRLEREVVTVRRPLVVAGLAYGRSCDHAANSVLAGQDLASAARGGVELF